jgi:hypothetical protein
MVLNYFEFLLPNILTFFNNLIFDVWLLEMMYVLSSRANTFVKELSEIPLCHLFVHIAPIQTCKSVVNCILALTPRDFGTFLTAGVLSSCRSARGSTQFQNFVCEVKGERSFVTPSIFRLHIDDCECVTFWRALAGRRWELHRQSPEQQAVADTVQSDG